MFANMHQKLLQLWQAKLCKLVIAEIDVGLWIKNEIALQDIRVGEAILQVRLDILSE